MNSLLTTLGPLLSPDEVLLTDNLYADVVVTSSSGGISARLFEQVRSTEGVSAASEPVRSKGWIEEPYDTSHTSDPWPLLGLNGAVYKGKVRAGSLDELRGSTIAVAVLDRRREFGLQRLSGSTRRQISKMLYLENLVIAAMGLVLGVVAACFSIFPIAIAIATRGWPIPSGPLWLLFAWIALVLLLVLPVTAIAGHLAMRPKPMDAVNSPAG
ncbi:FtsX-like permease family protein [Kribbella qitaiheensis]|uniref:FtsX-like permease family protein n=1 Tax=Kribbella qitaiheensis TaxID=1544730 RepID=UPI001FE47635|nr:ABC transporter permease [Kribbella qitaiheensis]